MKTTAILTTAGFAIFASPALAERPQDPGKQGRDVAAQQQVEQDDRRAAKSTKAKKAKKAKGVGFTLSGTGLTGSLPVADGALSGVLNLDVLSANRHARTFLSLDKAEIAGTQTFPVGTSGDEVVVRFDGLSATDALVATDRVKVIGKVTRVRKGEATAVRTLDIRKIVVSRGETETEQPEQPETETSGS